MTSDLIAGSKGPARVVIAGGGVAALEALLALRELAEERAAIELLAPRPKFVYKPLAVGEPFGLGAARTYDLSKIAEENGARVTVGTLEAVDGDRRRVQLSDGKSFDYGALLVAVGAKPVNPLPGSIMVQGPGYTSRFSTLLRELEDRRIRSVAFAVPSTNSWPLPLYELALMTAARIAQKPRRRPVVELQLVTPERAPLEVFGPEASAAVGELLEERGIEVHAGRTPAAVVPGGLLAPPEDPDRIAADRVVGLPRLEGPSIEGLPADAEGFIPVDPHGLVQGEVDVYAAGDATTFPLKQGGLATQQADAVAEAIAARVGAPVSPRPFQPVLRGMLLTGGVPRYLRSEVGMEASAAGGSEAADHALWWPPGKIAGRYLSPFLALREHEVPLRPDDQAIPVEVELERLVPGGRRKAVIVAEGAGKARIVTPPDEDAGEHGVEDER